MSRVCSFSRELPGLLAGSGWQIALDTYYATVKRPLPARAVPDPEILAEIRPTRTEYEEVYGAARRCWS
jgi:hypothetical protein